MGNHGFLGNSWVEGVETIDSNFKKLKTEFETVWGEGEKQWIPAGTQTSLRFHSPFSFTNATSFVILYNTIEHGHIRARVAPFSISSSQFPSGFVKKTPRHSHRQMYSLGSAHALFLVADK